MNRMLGWIARHFHGERRHNPRLSAERMQVVDRQYAAARRLARVTGSTPDELLDYRRADSMLARHR